MKAPNFEGITETCRQIGGVTRRLQELACTIPGCYGKISLPVAETRKPPNVVFNIARRKGWEINKGKRSFRCPAHKREKTVTTKETDVRQPTKEHRRAIFREIDEASQKIAAAKEVAARFTK